MKTETTMQLEKSYNPTQFAQEFKTIKVGGHRQSGHTTAALAILEKHATHGLLIVPFSGMVHKLKTSDKYIIADENEFIFSQMLLGLPADKFDIIVLDCSTLMSKTFKTNLTSKFNQAKLFLHLQ